jgi:predicted RND superfamily exporter protein
MAPTAVTIVLMLGGMALADFPFTPINLIVLPLALGIGVDNCVYIVGRMQEGLDLEAAVAHVGRAIGLTALTTMAGFGCLAVSRYPGLAGLGWLAAVSTLLTLVAAIVLLPAFLWLAPALRARATA